jgi:hypothetical protein
MRTTLIALTAFLAVASPAAAKAPNGRPQARYAAIGALVDRTSTTGHAIHYTARVRNAHRTRDGFEYSVNITGDFMEPAVVGGVVVPQVFIIRTVTARAHVSQLGYSFTVTQYRQLADYSL